MTKIKSSEPISIRVPPSTRVTIIAVIVAIPLLKAKINVLRLINKHKAHRRYAIAHNENAIEFVNITTFMKITKQYAFV